MSEVESHSKAKGLVNQHATAIVALVVGLLTGWMNYDVGRNDTGVNAAKVTAEQVDRLFKQVNLLQDKVTELQAQLAAKEMQFIEIRAQLMQSQDANKLLQMYIDSVPFPMWIKVETRVADEPLQMYMINNAYVREFGVTKREYIGRTDYDVYPEDLARQYEQNDRIVLATNGFVKRKEVVMSTRLGKPVDAFIWKFKIDLLDGRRGVGGFLVELEHLQ